jgi:hypothetical protein
VGGSHTGLDPMNFESTVTDAFQDINKWSTTNLLSLNADKTRFIQFINRVHGKKEIINTCNTKFLGLTLDNTFSWKTHPDTVVHKLSSVCFMIRTILVPRITEDGILFLFSLYHDLWTNILGEFFL